MSEELNLEKLMGIVSKETPYLDWKNVDSEKFPFFVDVKEIFERYFVGIVKSKQFKEKIFKMAIANMDKQFPKLEVKVGDTLNINVKHKPNGFYSLICRKYINGLFFTTSEYELELNAPK